MAPSNLVEETEKLAQTRSIELPSELFTTYVEFCPPEYLTHITPDRLLDLVVAHRGLSADRRGGQTRVSVATPNGWPGRRTIIQTVNEDKPFLVDSAEAALRRAGHRIHSVIHPVVQTPAGPESWMTIEISNAAGTEGQIQELLEGIFADVDRAVTDWQPMVAKFDEAAADMDGDDATFLAWLASGHFTILGYADSGEGSSGERLGVLRDGRYADAIDTGSDREEPLVVTKSPWRSTVHRDAYADLIIVNTGGRARYFLGLFTSTAYQSSVTDIPLVKTKAETVLNLNRVSPTSHTGRDMMEVLESYPRDLMFSMDVATVASHAKDLIMVRDNRGTKVFTSPNRVGRYVSVYVVTPRDQYNTQVRQSIESILREAYHADNVEYTTIVTEATQASLYYVLRGSDLVYEADEARVQDDVREAARNWDEDYAASLMDRVSDERAASIRSTITHIPEGYKARYSPAEAAADMEIIALGGPELNLYKREGDPDGVRRLKLYIKDRPALSDILPVITDLGLRVIDEYPFEFQIGGSTFNLIDFGLVAPREDLWEGDDTRRRFQRTLAAVTDGRTESDGFSALVLAAGLTWQEVAILRALAAYMKQGGAAFSPAYVASTLVDNPEIARAITELFATKFTPGVDGMVPDESRRTAVAGAEEALTAMLSDIASLDQERIIRWYLDIIHACVRTNVYDESSAVAMAFKLNPTKIDTLPEPRPLWEIFVYSPRIEGVHLRYGMVARGGLRWSDRKEDFRTEVLGLVKAQAVKNAVIVPAGAKGGFVAKQLPDPSDREAFMAEGQGSYEDFVSSLLSVTDNLVDGAPVSPVLRWDDPDTYLVVAADKGTAKFSDVANAIADRHNFWLGDAFASGGSAGYDHKAMGITARGAWESVKAHFRSLGRNCQTEDFTAVGVGDMSGDVFGNGMLLSAHTRLVAAFDHRHIFVDPAPVAESSYAERKRLFELPRSSWDDYDRSLISPGGGVWPRTAKSIPVSEEMARALGIGGASAMTPNELIHAILAAPVDLLFNGGIGTYIKGSDEPHSAVGDKANDAIRVDGSEVRAKIIGEGGNLGATQRGRIEAALNGVLVNTDAIDNSGGVDSSDYEVNIKILLAMAVRAGKMTITERNELLEEMTGEVASGVLKNNYDQNVLLANARSQSPLMLPAHRRLMGWLDHHGLNRELESLPSEAEIEERLARGEGLVTPEFAVLVAYTKLALKDELLAGDLVDDPWCAHLLRDFFPTQMRGGLCAEYLDEHPLRREIIANVLANTVVNRGGITFLYRAMEETGASAGQVVRAFLVAEQSFDMGTFMAKVASLDNEVPAALQSNLYIEFRRTLDRAVRWLINSRVDMSDIAATIERFRPHIRPWTAKVGEVLVGRDARSHEEAIDALVEAGLDREFATYAQGIFDLYSVQDVVVLSEQTGASVDEVYNRYSKVGERFWFDELLSTVEQLPARNFWETMAKSATRSDVYATLAALTKASIGAGSHEEWLADLPTGNVDETIEHLFALDKVGLAPLTVTLRKLRSLIGA